GGNNAVVVLSNAGAHSLLQSFRFGGCGIGRDSLNKGVQTVIGEIFPFRLHKFCQSGINCFSTCTLDQTLLKQLAADFGADTGEAFAQSLEEFATKEIQSGLCATTDEVTEYLVGFVIITLNQTAQSDLG